jgi:2-polyprenyl-3-methyl-5-hydroxy-6-metoxy-1,4-benzoquinol methylase
MCLPHTPPLPTAPTTPSTFDTRYIDALTGAALILMTSLGHRTGLFDVMAPLGWADAATIARAAGLSERYVREWASALATAGWLDVDPDGRFRLPAEHAAFLTRAAGPSNLAVLAQHIPSMAMVESDLVEAFRTGSGVPYSRYERFHAVMAEDSGISVLPVLESHVLPLVPRLTERLERGARLLDVGCGRGLALLQLAARFPRSRFHGLDLCDDVVRWARAEAEQRGLTNVTFAVEDATDLETSTHVGQWDVVTTFDAVHDQARPARVLRGIARALAPDGVYLMQDIHGSGHVFTDRDNPLAPLLYAISTMHCTPVSLAQGGDGLGTMWGRPTALALLAAAGFEDVRVHRLDHDPQNDWFVARLSRPD